MKALKGRRIRPTSSGRTGRRILYLSIGVMVGYTVYSLYARKAWGIEPNDTITQWLFTVFGVELCALMVKRIVCGGRKDDENADN